MGFLVSFMPYILWHVTEGFFHIVVERVWYISAFMFIYVMAALNPLLYYLLFPEIKNAYRSMFSTCPPNTIHSVQEIEFRMSTRTE